MGLQSQNFSNTEYYQAAATVRDESTLRRELSSLQAVKDQYPKYLLTLDDDPTADYDGIKRINALQWLLGNSWSAQFDFFAYLRIFLD